MKYDVLIINICYTVQYPYGITAVQMLSRSWPSYGNAHCEESQSRDEERRGGHSVGWLRNRHGMFCERTKQLISSAELALEQLSSGVVQNSLKQIPSWPWI